MMTKRVGTWRLDDEGAVYCSALAGVDPGRVVRTSHVRRGRRDRAKQKSPGHHGGLPVSRRGAETVGDVAPTELRLARPAVSRSMPAASTSRAHVLPHPPAPPSHARSRSHMNPIPSIAAVAYSTRSARSAQPTAMRGRSGR
jgi:hypothetical protein